jgi:hypothetical protein
MNNTERGLRGFEATVKLFDDPAEMTIRLPLPRNSGVVTIRLARTALLHYSEVRFPSDLQPNKNYVLKIVSSNISRVVPRNPALGEGWAPLYVSFAPNPRRF